MSGSWFVGLDVHKRLFVFCVLDENGKKVMTRTVRGNIEKLIAEFEKIKFPSGGFAIGFEASSNYGCLFERLGRVAKRVVVAHPGKLRLIFASRRKNDRVDAEKLAKLLFLDELPPVHVPAAEVRAWRRLIAHRSKLVGYRSGSKSRIRAILRTHDITAPKGLWTIGGIKWLRDLEMEAVEDALMLEMELENMLSLDAQIKRAEKVLDQKARRHPGVQLLMTIPGVGIRTAEAFVAHIDDPGRFSSASRVGSYFGLVPSQDQSGSTNRLGRITRQGPSIIRGLVAEAAWQGIRRSTTIRAFFERVRRDDPDRTKKAIVATAHYLVRVMYAMLRTGEVWRDRSAA